MIQVVISLMNRESEQLIHELSKYPIGIVARECLANGFLAGVWNHDTKFKEGTLNARYTQEELSERINQVQAFEFLKRGSIDHMATAALRWVLDQKGVSTVLTGAKNIHEMMGAVAASEASPYTEEELARAKELLKRNFEAA